MRTVEPKYGRIEVTDFCDVSGRARELGLNDPNGLSLLPRNFEQATTVDDLLHEGSVDTVRTLFRLNGITESRVERSDQQISIIIENNFELALPTLFVGGLILSENPHLLSLALSILANYATEFFMGIPGPNEVSLSIISTSERKDGSRTHKKVDYKGPVEGMAGLNEIIREVSIGEDND